MDRHEVDRHGRRGAQNKVKPPAKTKCLGVFGLSVQTSEDKIHDIFGKFGKIKRINVIFDTKVCVTYPLVNIINFQ